MSFCRTCFSEITLTLSVALEGRRGYIQEGMMDREIIAERASQGETEIYEFESLTRMQHNQHI